MGQAELLSAVRNALRSLNPIADAAIQRELAEPIDLGHSERLQFEVCPLFFGVKLVQTEGEIIADSAVLNAVPERVWADAESSDLDVDGIIAAELPKWVADRWEATGGPTQYRAA